MAMAVAVCLAFGLQNSSEHKVLFEKGDREFKITKIHSEISREGYFSPDGQKIAFSRTTEYGIEFWLVENFLPIDKKEK
jgi:hypothetical protein